MDSWPRVIISMTLLCGESALFPSDFCIGEKVECLGERTKETGDRQDEHRSDLLHVTLHLQMEQ